jgi:hypothetical protein
MTTFYCLRFETPPTQRARSQYLYPPEYGGPVIPLGIGLVPFSSSPTTRRATVEVFGPASMRGTDYTVNLISLLTTRRGPRRQPSSSIVVPVISMRTCLSAKASPSSGRVYLLIKKVLPRNGCRSAVCFEAVA